MTARLIRLAALLVVLGLTSAARADGEDFTGKDIRMRDYSGKSFNNAKFVDSNCFLTVFKDALLNDTNWQGADVTSATFTNAEMNGANFQGAEVLRAMFQSTKLNKANFQGVDMKRVSFLFCEMKGANLKGVKNISDVNRADLRGADLRGANLRGANNFSTAKLQGAKYDKSTLWPLGFDYENSGAVMAEGDSKDDAPKGATDPKSTSSDPVPQPKGAQFAAGPDGAPPVDVVKKLIEKQWGPVGNVKHVFTHKSIRFGAPAKEVVTINGQGEFTGKVLYPVRIMSDIEIIFYNGTSRMETRHSTFNFFRDSFGEWSFRFIENN
jgi:uncharacterized protein YjbI with pentapeptide repeats